MTIAHNRFCINRKIAPNLGIEDFFKLVARCGLTKVELRNDMPSGKVTDSLSVAQVNALAERLGIEIITINALGRFNLLAERRQVLINAEKMLREANAIHAQALVLCPHCDATDHRADEEKKHDTAEMLLLLAPLFAKYGVAGYVEPLGFGISSLRSATLAQTIIRNTGGAFSIVLDSFHHYLYVEDEAAFEADIAIENIGLVHLSGVEDGRGKTLLGDEERIMLSPRDRMNNIAQVRRLEKMGYQGCYSFEPFSSVLGQWSEADIEREINHSIALLNA